MEKRNREGTEALLITPHVEPTVTELLGLLRSTLRVNLHSTNAVRVQGDQRDVLARLRCYWIDPIVTMLRLTPFVWRYRVIITYYHRHGYWLGILSRLFNRSPDRKWVWIGFAPNPRKAGLLGRLKEAITRTALIGHDLIICNSQPVVDMIKTRFPEVAGRVVCVHWGGMSDATVDSEVRDDGYVFCGGRTNRDFDTVLQAVSELRCPAVFVMAKDVPFPATIPEHVSVYRDIPEPSFYDLVKKARIVVLALKRADISSGQVVLCNAMIYAKPVIVAATAGLGDYVTDGKDALLYSSGNVEDLKVKLTSLLHDASRRNRLGQAARATYEQTFNSRIFAQTLCETINSWCGI